jgi:aryl-alcohol dehydrogenase-like predicted oxidoreductase
MQSMLIGLPADPLLAAPVVRAAGDAGLGIDVAPYYCAGRALELIAESRTDVDAPTVTSRIPCQDLAPAATAESAFPPGWIVESVQRQLARARLLQFRTVLLERWQPQWEPSRVLRELESLRAAGLADQVGIALPDFGTEQPWRALEASTDFWLEGDGSLVRDEFLTLWCPRYQLSGLRTQARAPYFHGWLGPDSRPPESYADEPRGRLFRSLGPALLARRAELCHIAAQLGVELPVLALAFVRSKVGEDGRVLVGCRTPAQLADNLRWWQEAELLNDRVSFSQ